MVNNMTQKVHLVEIDLVISPLIGDVPLHGVYTSFHSSWSHALGIPFFHIGSLCFGLRKSFNQLGIPYDVFYFSFCTANCARKMVMIIPLMYFFIFWSMINKNCLMMGSLVVSIMLTCSRVRASGTIMGEDTPTFLVENKNVWTRKSNWRPRSHQPLGRIERRRLVVVVERWDMLRKCVGRKFLTWKRRRSSLKEMW